MRKAPRIKGAVPTIYRGVTYRSRLEARVAQLIDELGLVTLYEPSCFLMAGGECYIPDWKIVGEDTYIEARGYCSARGREQIQGFVDILPLGAQYAVIREENCGGCCYYGEGKWAKLLLTWDDHPQNALVRCVRSVLEFQVYGQWVDVGELRGIREREGGTLRGGVFGGG